MEERLHIIPINDLKEHEPTLDYWCGPWEDEENIDLIIHNALDRRELYENLPLQ